MSSLILKFTIFIEINQFFLQGHPDIIQSLACHPSYNEIVYTLGVDGSLSMRSSDSKTVLWKTSVKVSFS